MKVCYTAIFGKYDQLLPPTIVTPGWQYFCITDDPELEVPAPYNRSLVSEGFFKDAKLAARQMKILCPFKGAELTVWHDANIRVQCNLDELVQEFHQGELTVMKHPSRTTINQEIVAVVDLKKDTFLNTSSLFFEYEKFLEKYNEPPLPATGVMIRSNQQNEYNNMMAYWWDYVSRYSHRDQLSFGIAAGMAGQQVNYMPFDIIQGSHFQWRPHG